MSLLAIMKRRGSYIGCLRQPISRAERLGPIDVQIPFGQRLLIRLMVAAAKVACPNGAPA